MAIQLAPLPTKIRQFEPILCLLQGKMRSTKAKSRHAKLRRAAIKQTRSARHSSQILDPDRLPTQSFARIMQENSVFYAINPAKLRLFTPYLRRPHMFGAIICCSSVKHSNFSKKICVTSGAEKFGRKTAKFSIKIFRRKPEISRRCPILPRFRSEKPH